jgi:hypothetical protein
MGLLYLYLYLYVLPVILKSCTFCLHSVFVSTGYLRCFFVSICRTHTASLPATAFIWTRTAWRTSHVTVRNLNLLDNQLPASLAKALKVASCSFKPNCIAYQLNKVINHTHYEFSLPLPRLLENSLLHKPHPLTNFTLATCETVRSTSYNHIPLF